MVHCTSTVLYRGGGQCDQCRTRKPLDIFCSLQVPGFHRSGDAAVFPGDCGWNMIIRGHEEAREWINRDWDLCSGSPKTGGERVGGRRGLLCVQVKR